MNINVVSYSRFSSANQRETSIEIQQEHIHKYCEENGLTIIREYVDRAQSATTDNRPQFQQMINDASLGIFSYVVIYSSSRFCRNIQDHLRYKEILESYGVRILCVNENFDETTPEGDLMSNFMMSINQYYSKDLARKMFLGCLETAKECKHVGGVPPLGYDVGKDQKYIINKSEAEAVKMIFNGVEEGYSYNEIAKKLNDKGYRTKAGKIFKPPFTDILNNRKYIGEYIWNKSKSHTAIGKRSSRLMKAETDIVRIPNGMPAIISKTQFLDVQEILEERREFKKRSSHSDYLLSTLMVCNICGYKMNADTDCNANGKNTSRRMNYRCNLSKKEHSCSCKPIKILYMDTYILNLVNSVLLNERYSRSIQKIMVKKLGEEYNKIKFLINESEMKINETKASINNLVRSLENAKTIAYQEIVGRIEQLTVERMREEDKLNRNKQMLMEAPLIHENIIIQAIRKLRKAFSTRTVEQEKTVINTLIKEIRYDNECIQVIVNLNAYLSRYSRKKLAMTIIENTDNVKILENHSLQNLNWSTLKIK